MQVLRSDSALFWAPEKARMRQPVLISSPCLALGSPENAGVRQPLLIFSPRLALWTPEIVGVT